MGAKVIIESKKQGVEISTNGGARDVMYQIPYYIIAMINLMKKGNATDETITELILQAAMLALKENIPDQILKRKLIEINMNLLRDMASGAAGGVENDTHSSAV